MPKSLRKQIAAIVTKRGCRDPLRINAWEAPEGKVTSVVRAPRRRRRAPDQLDLEPAPTTTRGGT